MSTENPISPKLIETFTPEQKAIWETISFFFEEGDKIAMASFFMSGQTEISIYSYDDECRGTIIEGVVEGNLSVYRTPKEQEDNKNNYATLAQVMIANGSAKIC